MDRHGEGFTPARLVGTLAGDADVGRALAWAARNERQFVRETIEIAEIPAPTFAEGVRAEHTAQRFRELGLKDVSIDRAGNVYGLLAGAGRPSAAYVAHLDTVFPADVCHTVTQRDGRLYGPGVGDNAAGLAGLLGALAAMQAVALVPSRPAWFVASVGEEGLGNLHGVIAATDRLGDDIDMMVAVEGSFFGRLSHIAVGSRRLEIACRTAGGHSWHDYGRPSAVHTLVRTAAAITCLPVPHEPRTTLNVGKIEGGIGVNVIAEQAHLLLDMRSINPVTLDDLTAQVRGVVSRHAVQGVEFSISEVGFRPAGSLNARHGLVQTCAAVLERLNIHPQYAPASTDANIPLSRGIPAVTLGITRGGGAHTRAEWIETAPLVRGVQQLVLVIMALSDPRGQLTE